jgi:hypothetical protein
MKPKQIMLATAADSVSGTAQSGRNAWLTEMLFCSNARQSFGGSRRFHPSGIFKVH